MAWVEGLRAMLERWAVRAQPHWPLLPALVLGAVLRFSHLLPGFLYGDEAEYAEVARSLAHDPRALAYPGIEGFAPKPFVSQPPLMLYAFAAASRMMGSASAGPLVVSALLGTATIVLVYAIGVLVRDRWLGGLAAGFLAVLPFHIAVSRTGQLDSGFTFLFTLTILLFLLWLRRPDLTRSMAIGGAAALTTMAKLPGILVLVPILVVIAARMAADVSVRNHVHLGPPARQRLRTLGLQLLAASLPLAVLGLVYLGHLWLLHATMDWVQKLGWQADRAQGGSGTLSRGWAWYFTSDVGLSVQWGFALMALVVAGFVLCARDLGHRWRPWVMLTLCVWPLVVLAFLLLSQRKEWFYALPLSPPAVVLAALPVHGAARWAWQWSQPAPGEPWWRTPGAVLAVIGLAFIGAYSPMKATLQGRVGGDDYGYGLRESAEWIDAQDPGAAQVGTTLGRFSLHLYNGHPTYHYYVNHTWLDQEAAAGRIGYVVRDPYLNLTYERDWLDALVQAHNGTLVQSFDNHHGRQVDVYRLSADRAS